MIKGRSIDREGTDVVICHLFLRVRSPCSSSLLVHHFSPLVQATASNRKQDVDGGEE